MYIPLKQEKGIVLENNPENHQEFRSLNSVKLLEITRLSWYVRFAGTI